MKRAETIIKEISKLEQELYQNYDSKTIKKAIEKCEKEHKIPISCDDLISVIYEGVCNDIILDEEISKGGN